MISYNEGLLLNLIKEFGVEAVSREFSISVEELNRRLSAIKEKESEQESKQGSGSEKDNKLKAVVGSQAEIRSTTKPKKRNPREYTLEEYKALLAQREKAKEAKQQESQNEAYEKLCDLKAKYSQLMNPKNTSADTKKALTPEEQQLVDSTMIQSDALVIRMKNSTSKAENIKLAGTAITLINKIKDYPLDYEILKRLYINLCNSAFNSLSPFRSDEINVKIRELRSLIANKLSAALAINVEKAKTLEDLKVLNEDAKKLFPSRVGSVNRNEYIERKIIEFKGNEDRSKLINEPSERVLQIMQEILSDDCDTNKVKSLIDSEVEDQLSKYEPFNRPTADSRRNRVYMQIGLLLQERADEFVINNPQQVLINLCRIDIDRLRAVTDVISHLIFMKKYGEALSIHSTYSTSNDTIYQKSMASLKTKIENAQRADTILGIINSDPESKEDAVSSVRKISEFFRYSKGMISLGKGANGKAIYLKDIWSEERYR